MARRQGRYLEGRVYMAWASLALLLASWAGVALHDQVERRQAEEESNGQSTATVSVTGTQRQAHTRTRGS